jgi:hypothetical protein
MKCSLSFLIFTFTGKTSGRDTERWLMDAKGCYGRNLREIEIDMVMDEAWDAKGLAHFIAGLPLARLILNVGPSIDMTDQDLGFLGLAVPSLEELRITPPRGFGRAATIRGVLSLLRNCPRMKELHLDFDAGMDETEPDSLSNSPSALATLDVLSSSITNTTAVAELFRRALPCLTSMTWHYEDDSDDSESDDASPWQVV